MHLAKIKIHHKVEVLLLFAALLTVGISLPFVRSVPPWFNIPALIAIGCGITMLFRMEWFEVEW
jgi:hypothetical protein